MPISPKTPTVGNKSPRASRLTSVQTIKLTVITGMGRPLTRDEQKVFALTRKAILAAQKGT